MIGVDNHLPLWIAGKKLPEFPCEEEEVLILYESVNEAKKRADMVSCFHHLISKSCQLLLSEC